ncbi:MAG: discoidin domain-containing protein [Sedimentisphaerales bacterium]|nr:discoidin domain-containing protein [Sedimentisphaerales bacterium]
MLYKSGYRTDPDFLESVALALDRATYELYTGTCAYSHSNFFTVPSVLAYENLRDYVSPSRKSLWETRLTGMSSSQYATHTKNWCLTAACGEYLRYINGFTTDTTYMETWISNNLPQLILQGLFRDGGYPYAPMAYDGFARLNLNLILDRGYADTTFPGYEDLPEYMRRGVWTGLLMQSPWGETPIGGRSAQHQWNETEMCFMYEVWADIYDGEGDAVAARAFKRAARLAYKSLRRWVRPNGSVWIVKNRMDPAERFGYESYSYLSQYNMWTAGFLSLAWEYANDTISEGPAPADIGGFAFDVPEFHKGFANCQGLYLQVDMDPEDTYNTAGLVRMHKAGVEPLVCPSASTSDVQTLKGTPELGMGIGWYTGSDWTSLAEVSQSQISSFNFTVNSVSSDEVDFTVTYNFSGVSAATSVTENYVVDPNQATVNASVSGSATQTKMRYAAFLYDGNDAFTIGYDNGLAQTKLGDSLMTMELTSHPSTPFVRDSSWVNSRNGYLEAIEGIVSGTSMTYVLRPELDPTGTKFIASNTYKKDDFSYYAGIPSYNIVSSSAGAEESGNPKENTYDNISTTRWANDNSLSNAWIEYDLGSPKAISKIFLDLYKGDTRTYPLKFEIDDSQVWSGWTSLSDSGWTQSFTPTIGQVVRISLTGQNSDGHYWFSIYETKISATCSDVIVLGMGLDADISASGGGLDCSVDTYDLAALTDEWLWSTPLKADISGPGGVPDNSVNLYDFAALADQWTNCNDPEDPDCL